MISSCEGQVDSPFDGRSELDDAGKLGLGILHPSSGRTQKDTNKFSDMSI